MRHWLVHQLGWNEGYPDAYWEYGRLMMRFICRGCGRVSGAHEVPMHLYNAAAAQAEEDALPG